MQRRSAAFELGFISDFLNERMPEHKLPCPRTHVPLNEFGIAKPIERLIELFFRALRHVPHDDCRKFGADDGRDLQEVLVLSVYAVDSSAKCRMHRRRQRLFGALASKFVISCATSKFTTFFEGIDQLLGKKRIAVAAVCNAVANFCELGLASDQVGHKGERSIRIEV